MAVSLAVGTMPCQDGILARWTGRVSLASCMKKSLAYGGRPVLDDEGNILLTPESSPQSLDDVVRRGAGQRVLRVEIDPPREPFLVRMWELLTCQGSHLVNGAAVIPAEERARSCFRPITTLFWGDLQVGCKEGLLGRAQIGRDPGNVFFGEAWLDRLAAARTASTVDLGENLLVQFPGEGIDAVWIRYHLEASQETKVGILLPSRVLPPGPEHPIMIVWHVHLLDGQVHWTTIRLGRCRRVPRLAARSLQATETVPPW